MPESRGYPLRWEGGKWGLHNAYWVKRGPFLNLLSYDFSFLLKKSNFSISQDIPNASHFCKRGLRPALQPIGARRTGEFLLKFLLRTYKKRPKNWLYSGSFVFIRHPQPCQLMNLFGLGLSHNSVKTCLTFESIFR